MPILEQIRQRRIQLGYSQEELGRRTVLSRTQISSIESGTADISLSRLARIAGALDCDLTLTRQGASLEQCEQDLAACRALLQLAHDSLRQLARAIEPAAPAGAYPMDYEKIDLALLAAMQEATPETLFEVLVLRVLAGRRRRSHVERLTAAQIAEYSLQQNVRYIQLARA